MQHVDGLGPLSSGGPQTGTQSPALLGVVTPGGPPHEEAHSSKVADSVEKFLGRPLETTRLGEQDVAQNEEGVRALAAAGAWRASSNLAERLLGESHPVDQLLRLRWRRIEALLRLREVPQAGREMSLLGDLRSHGWQYERYPGLYPGRTGSMVPFALLVLHATMPSHSKEHEQALARLYALMAECKEPGTAQSRDECAQILLSLVNVMTALQDYPNAIAHLQQLLELQEHLEGLPPDAPPDAPAGSLPDWRDPRGLLSLLGRTHLQSGNLDAAKKTYEELEAKLAEPDADVQVRLNRGIMQLALSEYEEALAQFDAALQLQPSNRELYLEAANNAAVCHLYCCRLSSAISTLEGVLKSDPAAVNDQTLVGNLANLYQMTDASAAAKETLQCLVAAAADDDFDMSTLNIGGSAPPAQ